MRRSKRQKSDSKAQREAEADALRKLGRALNTEFCRKRDIVIRPGVKAQVDGYVETEDSVHLVEVSAQLGKPKAAQKKKIAADVLKLAYPSTVLRERTGKRIVSKVVFIDAAARDQLHSGGWVSAAAAWQKIETVLVDIDPPLLEAGRNAKADQDLLGEG
jgi:hypothetical protein